jgi:ABC-2 type transport system permease protein
VATIPLAVGLDAMRQLAYPETDVSLLPPAVAAGILLVMTVVFTGVARWSLATLERRARIEGRLTMRWR